jgi:hypothetical protein
MFTRFPVERGLDPDRLQDRIAHHLGINRSQLICACGFNAHIIHLPRVLNVIGFSSFDALWSNRNFIFINDIYRALSIDNILSIYGTVGNRLNDYEMIPDLIASRLGSIEAQIEATINPIMLGSYKLDIRGIYENKLVDRELALARLDENYAVLRGLADEVGLLVRSGVLEVAEVFAHPGATVDEKARLVRDRLASVELVQSHLRGSVPDVERHVLERELANRA